MPWRPARQALLLLLLTGWCGVRAGPQLQVQGAKLTLWTPGHLDALHRALHDGSPMHADLRPARAAAAPGGVLGGLPAPAKLSLWVPRGQEQAAARDWQDDHEFSSVLVRQADDEDALLDEVQSAPMSPAWLRPGLRKLPAESQHNLQDLQTVPDEVATERRRRDARLGRVRRALGFYRPKRSPSPGPSESSSEDASVATDRKPPPPQAKAARSHQFITTRNEKEQPPVVHEVEPSASASPDSPSQGHSSHHDQPASPATAASGTSRLGAARDALGVRANEIPQGPRYSSAYEAETMRHASDTRQYAADNYGGYNAYSSQYGSSYGSGGYGPSAYGSAGYGPRTAPPTATPRRIIYYASLPDPTPQTLQQPLQLQHPLPGSSRVPHEYRGPPYDVNGALAADTRYPAYYDARSRFRAGPSVPRYTIIDAEPPAPVMGSYRSPGAGGGGGIGLGTPAPYRDRPQPLPQPAAYPQPYRIGSTGGSIPDAGPQGASPIQYTQYDYNGIGGLPPHLPSDPMSASGARTANSAALIDTSKPGSLPPLMSEDPYRGFNPRQPAPWSMQVGTRLTVKDDGYGGIGGLPAAARRFYVTSQQQPGGPGSLNAPLTARIPRPLDRSEARHRLLR